MIMEMEHKPTMTGRPALPLGASNNGVHIKDANGRQIASSSRPDEEAIRDMAFIVSVVNGHDMLCDRAWTAEKNAEELLGILSRLQSEHSDLIERERVLEAQLRTANDKLNAVPYYVFASINMRERGEMIIPSLTEWIGMEESAITIEGLTDLGYTVIVRRMGRVPFGVVLRRARHYGGKTVVVYAAGETIADALSRAWAKAEAKVQP